MKIALVQCPVWWTTDPPLGLAQVAGCLKAAGHDVAVFDLNIELWKSRPPQYANMWLWEQFQFWNEQAVVDKFFVDNSPLIEACVERILASDAQVVAFGVYHGSQLATWKVASMIKAADPKRLIVFGGQYFFLGNTAREIFRPSLPLSSWERAGVRGTLCVLPPVDVVIRGAGDEVFPALVAGYARTGRPVKVPGAVFRSGDEIVDGGVSATPRTLDHLPFADFTPFPMELYTDQARIPLAASRGCVWACRFCSTREFWDGYSHMSGDRIFAEVKHQRTLFPGRRHVEFYDITANGRPEALRRFAELMADARRARAPFAETGWKINAIVRPEMTGDLLRALRAGGCRAVIYGIESGSPRVLKRMNKNYAVAVAERVLKDTRGAGIFTTANFMVGFPGETEEDFQRTLDFLRWNRSSLDRVYPSATFTSLEEHSALTARADAFGVDTAGGKPHNLYWRTRDGANTYLVRLDRYRRFRALARRLGIDPARGLNGDLNLEITRSLAAYYSHRGETVRALSAYRRYLRRDPRNEAVNAEALRLRAGARQIAEVPA